MIDTICRICLHEGEVVDWKESLFELSGMSYKDCYYKYTDLNEQVPDPFPQSLCSDCSRYLQNFHLWIEKAIETQKLLEQTQTSSLCLDDGIADGLEIAGNIEADCLNVMESDDGDPFLEIKDVNKIMPSDIDVDGYHIKRQQRKRRVRGNSSIDISLKDISYIANDRDMLADIENECVNIKEQYSELLDVQATIQTQPSVLQRSTGRFFKDTEESKRISDLQVKDIDKQKSVNSDAAVHECVYFCENHDENIEIVNDSFSSQTKTRYIIKRKSLTSVSNFDDPKYEWPQENRDVFEKNGNIANIESECVNLLDDMELMNKLKTSFGKSKHKKKQSSESSYIQCDGHHKRSIEKKIRNSKETQVEFAANLGTTSVDIISDEEIRTKDKPKKKQALCSICSKILHSRFALKKHELTHQEDRERHLACPTCGLKTFNKTILTEHMKTHDSNREKKYKCEFCDKAFFNRGACNTHRRIHLGKMFKCPLCPREFFRQIDVDRHMPTHSQAPLNTSKSSLKNTYLVQCKECGKKIRSDNFSAHKSNHTKVPYVKCTICDKDFFSRVSCTQHMRRVHNRAAGQYDDIAFYYEKNRLRLSHVLMKQQECLTEKVRETNQ